MVLTTLARENDIPKIKDIFKKQESCHGPITITTVNIAMA